MNGKLRLSRGGQGGRPRSYEGQRGQEWTGLGVFNFTLWKDGCGVIYNSITP